VSFHHGFDQAQAEAQAALRTAFIAAIKAPPDFMLLLDGDANAGVAKAGGAMGPAEAGNRRSSTVCPG